MLARVVALATLLESADALRTCGATGVATRRAAIAGALAGIPMAANAVNNPLDFDKQVQYKERNYGDMPTVDTKPAAKAACDEGQRKTPDGFGGFKCVDKKTAAGIPDRVFGGDSPPPPPPPPAAPKKSVGESTRSLSSSSAPLTLEQLIENSIKQKETLLGRELTADEKAQLGAKVKALMGQ